MRAPGHIKKPDQNVILVGPLRFELKSQDPQSCRMDQATLRPLPHFYVRYKHSTATVTFKAQIVQDFFGILSILDPFLVLVEVGGDHLTTA